MIRIKNISGESVTTTISINEEHANLVYEVVNSKEDAIKGTIKNDKLEESIGSYTVSVPSGSRFKVTPTLSIGTGDYTTTSTTTSDEDGNIISKTFNIFKTV
jgi:hypothetical protein